MAFGKTSTENTNIPTTYHLQPISMTTTDDVIVFYNITDLDPLTNFTFTAYITDYLKNTKAQNQIIFSKCTFYIMEQQ